MRVYRVEHRELRNDPDNEHGLAPHYYGPFRHMPGGKCAANDYIDASGKSWFHFNALPCPAEDIDAYFTPDMLCACISLEQLRIWFNSPLGLAAMDQLGFVVRAYDVPEIAIHMGSHQCVFPHHVAAEAEVLPLGALEMAHEAA